MAQVKIYGNKAQLRPIQQRLSDVLHECLVECLKLPADKRFHRFIALEAGDFIYPPDRSAAYTIIEISIFEGRSVETKKALIYSIFERFEAELGINPQDVELTIFETPRQNWGIRGKAGDELTLNYSVEV
jgi:phenylpyruvate tautomerase PptA (4-oxalocrotonate tautomerase family)